MQRSSIRLNLLILKLLVWHRRADRVTTQHVWRAWRDAVVHRVHVKQAVVCALMRICHRSSTAALEHWQQYVAATKSLRLQQQHAVLHMQKKQLQKICLYWRALAVVKQRYKVSKQLGILCAHAI